MKRIALVSLLLVLSQAVLAETPFQFAAPNLRAPDDPKVSGIRLTVIHGRNQSVRGIDVGVISLSETGNLFGASVVLGIGKVNGDMVGFANSAINVHTGSDTGLNAAFVNRVNSVKTGANVGFVNISDGYTMLDLGGFNLSGRSSVQLGFLNVTRRLTGVQIGLLNLAENGFLPMFPIFNFPRN
jgi:hypothetical protein